MDKLIEHELKTWPVFYEKILDGSKPFEVRKNDRNFNVGDILLLREYDPDAENYTGRSCRRRITYILGDSPFFQINNTVIMGIAEITALESKPLDGELFEKVYIKSEADLPKDEGRYYAYCKKDIQTIFHEEVVWNFNPNNPNDISKWLRLVDYYLRPVSQSESKSVDQPGTADVEKKLLDLFGFIDGGVDAENQVKIFKFMDWYQSRPVVSDAEIKKWANTTPTCKIDDVWTIEIDLRYREGLEDGARAMRDGKIGRLQPANVSRDIILGFAEHCRLENLPATYDLLDAYLSRSK